MTRSRRIWHMGIVMLLLVFLLSCRLLYWQLFWSGPQSEEVSATEIAEAATATPVAPAATVTSAPSATIGPSSTPSATPTPTSTATPSPSPTPTLDLATIRRGTIYDQQGRRLAYDLVDTAGATPVRFYTEPSLAHVLGYLSGERRGVSGLEDAYDEVLLGLAPPAEQGNDLYLTIDSRVQRAAAQALSGKAGAIVVLDPATGAILAMASAPTFDANRILDPAYLSALQNCEEMDCRQPLFNRAAQGWYTPGSTWKTVTLLAALETGQVAPDTVFDFGPPQRDENGRIYYEYTVDGFSIRDPNHPERRLNLRRSYAVSANAAFARIGDEMPPEVMIDYAARLGFSRPGDEAPPLEIETSAARLASDPAALYTNNALRASTAIGQGELLASPLSMALVTAAVVNGGDIPSPHLTVAVHSPAGEQIQGEPNNIWIENVIRPETAALVRDMMVEVVASGSGRRAQVAGMTVGGKTGTAQVGGDLPPHAWFTGFVQDESGRTLVITVLVEHGGEGSQAAAPLFAQVADVAMRHFGEPVEEIIPEP